MLVLFLIPSLFLVFLRMIVIRSAFRFFRNQSDFLLGLYVTLSFLGVVNAWLFPDHWAFSPSIVAMLLLAFCLSLVFIPVLGFQNERYGTIGIPSGFLFDAMIIFFILGGGFSLIILSSKVELAGLLNASQVRAELVGSENVHFSGGIIESFAINVSLFFGVMQILGMVVYCFNLYGRKSSLISFLLIVSSLSYVSLTLVFAGREGVVYWTFSFLFNLSILSTVFSVKVKILKKLLAWGLVFSLPIFVITYTRFGSESFFFLFFYFSQQIPLFNDYVSLGPELYLGSQNFSWFLDKVGFIPLYDQNDLNHVYLAADVIPWGFPTFVGTIFKDFGIYGTAFFFIVISVLVSLVMKILKRRGVLSLDRLLFYYLHAQVIFMGVFYFKHAFMSSYIVAHLMLVAVLFFLRATGCFKNFAIVKTKI